MEALQRKAIYRGFFFDLCYHFTDNMKAKPQPLSTGEPKYQPLLNGGSVCLFVRSYGSCKQHPTKARQANWFAANHSAHREHSPLISFDVTLVHLVCWYDVCVCVAFIFGSSPGPKLLCVRRLHTGNYVPQISDISAIYHWSSSILLPPPKKSYLAPPPKSLTAFTHWRWIHDRIYGYIWYTCSCIYIYKHIFQIRDFSGLLCTISVSL